MSEKSVCMDAIPQGVFILGTRMGDIYNLMTAAFVTQVSFNPCSVAVSVANNHYTAELIAQQGQFSLSVLAEGQEAEAKACGYQSGRKVDKSARVRYVVTEDGLPVLEGAAAWMVCKVRQTVEYEDHTVFFAEISDCARADTQSMIYKSQRFFPN